MKRVGVLVAGFIALAVAPALAQNPDVEAQEVSRKLNRLFLDHAIASRPLFPLFATMNGWREYDGQFANDISEEHREAQHQFCRRGLENLKAFDRSRLDEHDQLSYDVYRYNQLRCLDGLGFDLHLLPIDQGGVNLIATFPIWGSGKGPQPFRNAGDYENFLKRITGFVGWMDTTIANMRRGIARGFVQPREVMEKTLPQLSAMILDDVKQSPFYEPIADMPEEIEGEDRRRLSAAYEDAIRNQIVPAYRRVRDFVRDEYLPKCRATAGLTGLPGGDRLYAHYIRVQTTSSLTPQEIFDLGHREVARLRERMEALKKASVFDGDLKDWAVKLRNERVRYAKAEDVIEAYNMLHERVYPQLEKLFGSLPQAKYEIRQVEEYREQSAPNQYWRATRGRPAVFYLNLRALRKEPQGVSMSLFLHETLPGHHLQMALAQENRALPGFRRVGHWHGFVEGWAMYAEDLGFDMGLYHDPYQHLNKLAGDQFHAARMVTDVGLHVKGWSREQAIQFMRDTTLGPHLWVDFEGGVASSVERQMSWPGYALGYKIGQLKILELRARAESRLGPKFELRAFHDELLKDGAMPLEILEAKMDRWIARQR
ncbi:MAG: DUF885 domain-containing protein [Burkholderiales bacterium]